MKVNILTEANKKVGFGHLSRVLSLYDAFHEKKINPQLIINADNSITTLVKDIKYLNINWLKNQQKIIRSIKNSDITIIDSYLASIDFYKKVSKISKIVLYIDDTKRLDYPKGIVFNAAVIAKNLNYPKKKNVNYLLGLKYVLLRKEFIKSKKIVLKKIVKSILLTLGGTDIRQLTIPIIKKLTVEFPDYKKNVIIGKGYNNLNAIKKIKDKNIFFHFDPPIKQFIDLINKSDIAISAGGQSMYELTSLGIPTIAIIVANNQLNIVKGLNKVGVINYFEQWNDSKLLSKLIADIKKTSIYDIRHKQSKKGKRIIDGQGSKRVIDFMIDKISKKIL